MSDPLHTPVLIVGGGPVGLALSIDLSWRGVRHVLIDRDTRAARARHPRMDQVSVRAMEQFRRLGLTDAIEAAGFPRDIRRDVVFATGVLGFELAREPFDPDATRPAPPTSPQKHELCPQNFLDPALQTAAERGDRADIRYSTRIVALDDDGARVRCALETAEGDRYDIDASYVAGCDGGGGFVAERLNVGAADATVLARSTNLFFECPGLRERATDPAYRYILVGAEGVWASLVNIDGRDTWRLQVLGDAGRAVWTEPEARAAVERSIGRACPFRLTSIVPWARRELIVDHFSVGRCFLLGDAAHQFSPTGGYGMTTGLGESFNLGWKLAATLEGWGGPGLLPSYAIERRPIAIRNAQRATHNFRTMRSLPANPVVEALSPEGEAARREAGHFIREAMREEWESMGIHLGYSYAGSPVIVDDGAPGQHSHPVRFEPSAAPGMRAPHAWLSDGRSTLDLFGRGFVLLDFGAEGGDGDALLAAAERRRVPLRRERIDNADAARLYERRLVLVRPDGQVAARGDTLPDPDAVIARVRGAA